MPIWLSSAAGSNSAAATGRVRKATVVVAAHKAATAAGADALIFAVTRADDSQTAGQIKVRLSYARFADAYGGGFGERLQLFAMPACALTTPKVKACRKMAPVPAVNDGLNHTLSATVAAEPAIGRTGSSIRSAVVYAMTSTTSGGTGDFKATSLAPSSQWQVGLQTGDFNWSYPLRVPPAIGGSAPSLSLSYDSGATDGETAQDNSQPGQTGEGFSLNGSVGFIERRYVSCGDMISKSSNDTDQTFSTGDECWDGENAFLSIGGHSTELIKSGSTWHLADDDGSTVQVRTDTTNGAYQNQYWEIIVQNGTQYYYGLNELPGFQAGNTQTNSVWTMPIFGLGASDPCHANPANGTGNGPYATAYCANMPWRWNLDLVVDPNGNATSYFYNKETNYYASDSYVDGSGTLQSGTVLPYTSGGTLTDIWYGMQDSSATSPNSGGNVYAHKAFNVHLTYADRCSLYGTDTTYNTDYGNTTTKSTCENNETEASGDWPDTPWDLACSSTANCTGPNHDSPVFFDTQMLATVTTNVEQGFNSPEAVDTWTLGYNWKTADVNSDLVLRAIIHAGDVGHSPVSLHPVILGYDEFNNRVPYGENFPAMQRYRITSVTSETGAQTDIGYNAGKCSSTKQTDPSTNNLPCFPQEWTAGDFGGSPTVLWFYKYTVSAVTVNDPTGDEPTMLTTYTYCNNKSCGAPNTGAAWHFDTDVDLVPEKDKSYGQWRGYQYVDVVSGASGDTPSETDYTFMRGMYGDPLPNNTTDITAITPSDTTGTTQTSTAIDDVEALNGFELEKISHNGLNTAAQVADVVNWPWTSTTGTSVTEPWGAPLTSVLSNTAETDIYTPLSPRGNGGTAGTRQTQTVSQFDSTTGLPTKTDDVGDVSVPSQETCTNYTYPSPASPATANLLNFPAEVKVTAGSCAAKTPPLISDTQYSYDGQANGVAPVSGNVTETDVFSSGDSTTSGNHWVKQSRDGYDSYGRLTTSENADGFTTTTTFTSSFGTGYPTTGFAVNSKLTASTGETVATTLQPEWGSPATHTDADQERTDYAYDALGRVTSVWLPGQTGTTPAADGTASYSYSYTVLPTVPPSVTTTKLVGGNQLPVTSVEIFDSLLRPRQTQTSAEGSSGGMEVTDTFYDSRGNTVITNGPYPAASAPSGSLWEVTEPAVPNETLNTYDGANRLTLSDFYSKGTLNWGTSYTYTGSDEITEIPPSGGTITSTFTDARGNTAEVDQYHSKTAASGNYDATAYTYTPAGQLDSVTDAGGNRWRYTYDLLGRQLTASDPDTGTTTNTYNDVNQLTSVTDGAGDTVSYTYDAASRKTGEYDASVGGQAGTNQLAAWTYDSSAMTAGTQKAFGLLDSETSYVGGTAGEAYTKTINTYDVADNPVSTTWAIPSNTVTGSLAGTYTFGATYNLDDGTPSTLSYPANGPLPAETVNYIEDTLGNPHSEWSSLADYVTDTVYNDKAQPSEVDLGLSTAADWTRMEYGYNLDTQRLTQTQIQRESTNWANDTNTGYNYDDGGNITAISESVAGNDQCFKYDYLARLTAAWAQSTASCPSSAPAATGLGGPQPYEQTVSYDNTGTANGSTAGTTGNITGATLITGSGGTATTTATGYTYGAAQPHAPTNQSTSVNGGTATSTTLNWTGASSQPGYLGSETGGTSASYNWDGTGAAPGQLFLAKTGTKTTNYRYDADGSLLVVKDGSASVLYLPNETLTATGTTVSGTRYYSHDGMVVAARTSASAVSWLLPDPQGTATAAVNASSQVLTRRYYTPYGVELGAPPSGWPGNKGYVGGKTDATTGLVDLGAREYNPALPVFISPDPVLTPADPTDLNPYSYAFNNPVTHSDPSGMRPTGPNGTCSTVQTCPSVSLDNNPIDYGGWVDYVGGVVNGVYGAVRSGLEIGALMDGGPRMEQAVASALPSRLDIGNPNTVAYRAGIASPFLIPLGGEEAAAAEGLGILDRLAIGAAPERLAIEAAPERLAIAAPKPIDLADSGIISARSVRFTQDSVGANFRNGNSVMDLGRNLANGTMSPTDLPPIRLFTRYGDIFSLDNRRVFAGQMADISLPYRMATDGELARELGSKFTTYNNGTGIEVRGIGFFSWFTP